ncbi:hypothetical protein, partial [Rhizobium pisi]|uniref:hypothetical protein n=1 Tax=Rhizobium pisi TaxID=574561 RepID=UPI001ABFF483
PTDQPHGKFLTFFHHLVSTFFGGHLMPELTQLQKVRGKSRLPLFIGKVRVDIKRNCLTQSICPQI